MIMQNINTSWTVFVNRGVQRRTGGEAAIGLRGVGYLISIINPQETPHSYRHTRNQQRYFGKQGNWVLIFFAQFLTICDYQTTGKERLDSTQAQTTPQRTR
jgi:hypothetical protein